MPEEKTDSPKQGDIISVNVQETVSADFLGVLDVELLQRLRYLPGRRSVWMARFGERKILLKLYVPHSKQERDAGNEWKNAVVLQDAELDVPDPLFQGRSEGGVISVAFTFVEGGTTLDEVFQSESLTDESDRHRDILFRLVDLHRRQHEAGVYQKDDHLGNYLWNGEKVWMLDAGTCVCTSAPLTGKERLKNMALLAANMPLSLNDEFHNALKQSYGADGFDDDIFKSEEKEAILTRLRNYYKKTRRSCSEFEHIKTSRREILLCRDFDEELKEQLLSDPNQYFGAGKDMIKNGRTCSVVDIHFKGKSYILKRYNQKSLLYRLSHLLMTPRALLSWSNGHVLRLFGVPTSKPVVCMITKTGLLVRRGYLLMEKVDGVGLHKVDRELMVDSSQDIPRQFAAIWKQLDLLNASHGDMKSTNFMVARDGTLILIDLDSMKFHGSTQEKQRGQAKDLNRFKKNWEDDEEVLRAFE